MARLKQVQVRMDPEIAEMVHRAAALIGISAADFIRGAACARAAFTLAQEEPELVQTWMSLYREAQRAAQAAARPAGDGRTSDRPAAGASGRMEAP